MDTTGRYRFSKQIVQAIEKSRLPAKEFVAAAKRPDQKGNYEAEVFQRLIGQATGGATLEEYLSFCVAVQEILDPAEPYRFGEMSESQVHLPGNIRDCPATHLPAGLGQATGDRVLLAPGASAARVLAVSVAVVFLLYLVSITRSKAPPIVPIKAPSKGPPQTTEPLDEPEVKVRIEATIEIKVWKVKSQGDATFRGVLGKGTFSARQGDQVDISIKLSRPGYGYLLALRADNKIELCSPLQSSEKPAKVAEIVYRNGGKQYVLSEAPGVWAFAVIASDNPLPPFEKWPAAEKTTWTSPPNADAGKVWISTVDDLFELTADGAKDPILGTDDENHGAAVAIRKALYQLLGEEVKSFDVAGSAIGFVVEPKREP